MSERDDVMRRRAGFVAELKRIAKSQEKLTIRRHIAEGGIVRADNDLERLRRREIVAAGISAELDQLRTTFIEFVELAKSRDITVRQEEELQTQVLPTAKKALQAACPHPFVLGESGYAGSLADDFDDRRAGHRWCLVCHLTEQSGSYEEDMYRVLIDSPSRFIASIPYNARIADYIGRMLTMEEIKAVFTPQ